MLNLNRGMYVREVFNKYKFTIIFLSIMIMSFFFPLVGKSLFYKRYEFESLASFLDVSKLGVFASSLLMILSKWEILKVLVYGTIATSLFIFMKNVVDKKNTVLMFVAGFFFFIIDKELFSASFVNLSGFVTHFIGSLFLVILLDILSKSSILSMKRTVLFILGLVGTSINPVYSFVFLAATFGYMFLENHESSVKHKVSFLFLGEILGILSLVLYHRVPYSSFSSNLIHEFIPLLSSSNFIMTLIVSALILFSSIKIFLRGQRIKIVLSMLGIVSFLFASLLSESDIVCYVTFACYMAGSMYIVFNLKNSLVFKRKMIYYYSFKILAILFMCIFGSIERGSLLFISLLDIMIILEFYDYALPREFLNFTWAILFVLMAGVNIYIYSTTMRKFNEMNFYIKNKLECTRGNYSIPNKYHTDYLYDYIPSNLEDLKSYIGYYKISPYDSIEKIELYFND